MERTYLAALLAGLFTYNGARLGTAGVAEARLVKAGSRPAMSTRLAYALAMAALSWEKVAGRGLRRRRHCASRCTGWWLLGGCPRYR